MTKFAARVAAGWLNTIAPYLLAPLYGVPPGTYRLHHVIMHHVEDNKAGWDLSATEGYQRDSLAHFARCVGCGVAWNSRGNQGCPLPGALWGGRSGEGAISPHEPAAVGSGWDSVSELHCIVAGSPSASGELSWLQGKQLCASVKVHTHHPPLCALPQGCRCW